ncbi:hypothetical protein ACJIZ3_020339 [Penstemon smallii]|uniref:Aspartate racemase n=1 Tax=Penstemon smallii TaxID=265156 RepID=A0ABD3SIM0_9LAMI
MSLCFQPFNILTCCLSKRHIGQNYVKKNPTLVKFPSSIEGNFTGKSNSIGIIGGVLVDSTLSFAKKLVSLNNSEDEENGPPFVLSLDPALSKELSSIGRNESRHSDRISLVENLRFKRKSLERSGVGCIVMPCHISHTFYDEIEQGCSVPFLHMGECVANELKEANLRPIEAGSPVRIGVLATNQTLVAKFYQEKLENEFRFVLDIELFNYRVLRL